MISTRFRRWAVSRSALGIVTATACEQPVSICEHQAQGQVAPADTVVTVGETFTASVRLFCRGSEVTDVVTWRSEDTLVAPVDSANGIVTGRSVGVARIVATGQRYGELGAAEVLVYNPTNPTSAEAKTELRYYIERVTRATARKYSVRDNTGRTMDGVKIIANPDVGGFIGVYQTYRPGLFDAHLATSTDLLNWTWRVVLARTAAQPTIRAVDGGYVVAWETDDGQNHLGFAYYDSWTDVLRGSPSKRYDAPRLFSPCAEGTPNIYQGDSSRVEVGFHYWSQCDVGRQARGVTDWSSWSAVKDVALDTAITTFGVAGVGDRDGILRFRGHQFSVVEGEFVRFDWTSWRIFLYDHQTGTAEQLNIQTDARSISFGNPTVDQVEIGGRSALVMTLYVFLDGARGGEVGALVYYRVIP